jgi:hypothetical protein
MLRSLSRVCTRHIGAAAPRRTPTAAAITVARALLSTSPASGDSIAGMSPGALMALSLVGFTGVLFHRDIYSIGRRMLSSDAVAGDAAAVPPQTVSPHKLPSPHVTEDARVPKSSSQPQSFFGARAPILPLAYVLPNHKGLFCHRTTDLNGATCDDRLVAPNGRLIIVGDVHGCQDEVERLMRRCDYDSKADQLIYVGDLIGKGPRGADAVRYARREQALVIRGNHEDFLLKWRGAVVDDETGKLQLNALPSQTHRECAVALTDVEWRWLAALPLWLDLPEYNATVVHAGVRPDRDLREQTVRDLLYMRNITADGTAVEKPRDGGTAWAAAYAGERHVVFGHDAKRGLQTTACATGLDTGAVYGKTLTALVVPRGATLDAATMKAAQLCAPPVDTVGAESVVTGGNVGTPYLVAVASREVYSKPNNFDYSKTENQGK